MFFRVFCIFRMGIRGFPYGNWRFSVFSVYSVYYVFSVFSV